MPFAALCHAKTRIAFVLLGALKQSVSAHIMSIAYIAPLGGCASIKCSKLAFYVTSSTFDAPYSASSRLQMLYVRCALFLPTVKFAPSAFTIQFLLLLFPDLSSTEANTLHSHLIAIVADRNPMNFICSGSTMKESILISQDFLMLNFVQHAE